MKKLNKRQIAIMAIAAILVIALIIVVCVSSHNRNNKTDNIATTNENVVGATYIVSDGSNFVRVGAATRVFDAFKGSEVGTVLELFDVLTCGASDLATAIDASEFPIGLHYVASSTDQQWFGIELPDEAGIYWVYIAQ